MNLKAIKGKNVIVEALDEIKSGILFLPETKIERGGSLCRCKVVSSGFDDIPINSIVHCRAELGYRVPLTSLRIYLREDITLIEDFSTGVGDGNADDVTASNKLKSVT